MHKMQGLEVRDGLVFHMMYGRDDMQSTLAVWNVDVFGAVSDPCG